MWYTPISGIWQTVWLESVPENYIKEMKIDVSLDSVTLRTNGGTTYKTLSLLNAQDEPIKDFNFTGDDLTI
jgi:hypothetical protein